MAELNLLDRYPRAKRNIKARADAVPRERTVAMQFGREYFDGDRTQGYGGYRYDGRWVPIAERIRDHYGLKPGHSVLDVGCAKGFLLHDLQQVVPGLQVWGLDVSAYALANAMESLAGRLLQGSADALPFGDHRFDVVLAINSLHNLPRDRCAMALREVERVGRERKYVQVDSWLNEEQRENFERWQLTAQTYFAPDGWRALFVEAGYRGDYYWTLTE
jgi:SAM-dependent methyltransferase